MTFSSESVVLKWLLLWVFAKASLHLVSVVMTGHVQDGAATSRVRREISVFIATNRPANGIVTVTVLFEWKF